MAPSFMTKTAFSSRRMSCSGLPVTAMMSARYPGAIRPTRSSQRISSAAWMVAVGELAGVEAVRVDAAVRTERDAHASCQALGESWPGLPAGKGSCGAHNALICALQYMTAIVLFSRLITAGRHAVANRARRT
jgi:hypothetical protein